MLSHLLRAYVNGFGIVNRSANVGSQLYHNYTGYHTILSIEGYVETALEDTDYTKSCFSHYPVFKTRSLDTFADEL